MSVALIALITSTCLAPSAAMGAAPPNDNFDTATVIGALPFTDSLVNLEATSASDDPNCTASGRSIWYSFTPSANVRVDADTFGSDYDTVIAAYTGSRGSLSEVACNNNVEFLQSRILFDATAGTTYHIMVGSFVGTEGGWPEGNLQLSVREAGPPPPPPQIELSVDRSATVDKDGIATISGSLACNQRLFGWLEVVMQQTFGHRYEVSAAGYGTAELVCRPPSVRGTATVRSFSGQLRPGSAGADVDALYFCSIESGCTYVMTTNNEFLLRATR